MNIRVAAGQLWPGILIQAIDIVQPPGMSIPPAIERHHAMVAAEEPTKRAALTAYRP